MLNRRETTAVASAKAAMAVRSRAAARERIPTVAPSRSWPKRQPLGHRLSRKPLLPVDHDDCDGQVTRSASAMQRIILSSGTGQAVTWGLRTMTGVPAR